MTNIKVVFDKELVSRKLTWETILKNLDCERSFVTRFNAKAGIFQAAKKLGIKVISSQVGLEKNQLRIWRIK